MRDWYFYQERGKTMGPLTIDDLRARIRDGRLRLFDLIYKEGESDWRMALEHPDLRDEFKAQSGASLQDRPWVCLHRKSETGFEFLTMGPYSTAEIQEAVRAGRLSYNDYVWKEGFPEWKRMGGVEEFNPRAGAKAEVPPLPDTPEELLKNVVAFKRGGGAPPPLPKPPEAAGPDLTKIVGADRDESVDPDATRVVVPRSGADPRAGADPDATRIVRPAPATATDPDATRVVRSGPAIDPDATRIVTSATPLPPLPVEAAEPPARTTKRASKEPPSSSRERRAKRRKKRPAFGRWLHSRLWTDWGIVGGLVLILLIVIVALARHVRPSRSVAPGTPPAVMENIESQQAEVSLPPLEPVPPSSASSPSEPVTDSGDEGDGAVHSVATGTDADAAAAKPSEPVARHEKPSAVEPTPGSAPQKSIRPTQLTLVAQSVNGGQARIQVRSNGSADFPVYLQIVGLPGQVSDGPSFYRYLRLKADPSGQLRIPDLKLPQGRFRVRAETGDLHKEEAFNLGTGETHFHQAEAETRRTFAADIWHERLRLYHLSDILADALAKPAGSAKSRKRFTPPKSAAPLAAVKKTNGGHYIFFDDWWELHEVLQEARATGPSPALAARARRVRDRMASFSVWRVK